MTDRPTEVWIGPHHYDIIYDEAELGLQAMDDGSDPAWAHISFVKGQITLDPRRPESGIRDSLIHEILHGVWHNVGLPASSADLGGYNEEIVVNALATQLMQVLRMNPTLLDYMVSSKEG